MGEGGSCAGGAGEELGESWAGLNGGLLVSICFTHHIFDDNEFSQ